jgi:hypothetical protein
MEGWSLRRKKRSLSKFQWVGLKTWFQSSYVWASNISLRTKFHNIYGREKTIWGCSRTDRREVILGGDRMKMDGGGEERKRKELQCKEEEQQ